jgi:hypothetical protein
MWKKAALLSLVFTVGFAFSKAVADDHQNAASSKGALERFKQLAGEWVGKEDGKGDEVHAIYRVTSNGSAVMETLFPGTNHEMITMIHPDGDSLVLTHYCAIGNQPHMKAKIDGNKYDFDFVSGTNMKSENDMHMHGVSYTFVNDDTLRATWTMYRDGKKVHSAVFEMKRKK